MSGSGVVGNASSIAALHAFQSAAAKLKIDVRSVTKEAEATMAQSGQKRVAELIELCKSLRESLEQKTVEATELKQLVNRKQSEIRYLKGEGNPGQLSFDNISDLLSEISNAQRKVSLAHAVLIVKQQQPNQLPGGEENVCIVCFERAKNTRLGPCGHLLCSQCSKVVNRCPTCRKEITERQPVFF